MKLEDKLSEPPVLNPTYARHSLDNSDMQDYNSLNAEQESMNGKVINHIPCHYII